MNLNSWRPVGRYGPFSAGNVFDLVTLKKSGTDKKITNSIDSHVKFQAYTLQLSRTPQDIFLNAPILYCKKISGRQFRFFLQIIICFLTVWGIQ